MSEMNINSKQATFTIPIFCKDQAADIRIIEDAANKALRNIHSLYSEIMTPKINPDADYEASVSDYSSDSASVLIGSKNGCRSLTCVPKPLPEELCNKCQKLVSLCFACHKQDFSNSLQNHRHPRIINKTLPQERSNSYPRVKPFRRNSSYHPEQKYSHLLEQAAQRNPFEERRVYHHPEESAKKKSQYPESVQRRNSRYSEVRRNSQYPEEAERRNSHYPEGTQRNSLYPEETRRNSHYPEEVERRNSQYPEEVERRNSHYTDEARRNSHYTDEARRNSHYPENVRKNSDYLKQVRRNSHHPDPIPENSHDSEESQRDSLCQRKFSRTNSIQKEQNNGRDFNQKERKSSYYPESFTETNSEYDDYPNYTFKSVKESKIQFSITVPKPFSLSAENIKRQQAKEEKISKMRDEIDSQIKKELNVKFSPKPVPKHVNLPLYGEMVKMNEQRKKERREKCIEILNEKTKPFNLSASTRTCVSKSMSNLSQDESKTFKAKPVPKNILSENISQKIKNKEEIRKLLIAQRAEEMLRKSSLPFSPKSIPRSHSLFNVSDSPSKSNINVTKEKIEAITNRLYSIKCQETIENWNNKVLQNDLWSVEMYSSKKSCLNESSKDSDKDKKLHKSALPFHNFPVRKTTTTFLREKRIRADIEMRKRREEKDESIREEIARKKKEILKNIWSRLKSAEQMHDIGKEIEEKVKSYRESQKNREQEYEKELEDMMRRVSKQFLLIERQSKELKEKVVDTNKNVDELTEKEVSSSEESPESDSLKEVESPASSASSKSDSPTPSASEKSDSS